MFSRVAIGDPNVADVITLKGNDGVLIVGKAAGTTDLLMWERGQDVPRSYVIDVRTSASAALLGHDTPQMKVLGKTAVLSGSTPTVIAHERAAEAARASVGKDGALVDTSTVAVKSVVQVDVKVVEFSKSVLKEAGFNLFAQNHAGFAFGTFAPSTLDTVTGGATNPLSVNSTSPIGAAFNLFINSTSRGCSRTSVSSKAITSRACSRSRRSSRCPVKAPVFLRAGKSPFPCPSRSARRPSRTSRTALVCR